MTLTTAPASTLATRIGHELGEALQRTPVVPVLATKYALGWPEHEHDSVPVRYMSLGDALTTAFLTDAHVGAYSVPAVARRLATESVFEALPGGVVMVLFAVDIEPAGHVPITPDWRRAELAKLDRLFGVHPGGHAHRTRGGHRIYYVLAVPVVLRSLQDAERWRQMYNAWLDILDRQFGIVGDRRCADWTRLFRLPFVVRDGEPQMPRTIGDARAVGAWDVPVNLAEPAVRTSRSLATARAATTADLLCATNATTATGFFGALAAHDQGVLLIDQLSGTQVVHGEKFTLAPANDRGNQTIIVEGRRTGGYVDVARRIVHLPSDRSTPERPDGGPTVATWLRFYGWDDKQIRQHLVELVPGLRRFAPGHRTNRTPTPGDLRGDR